MKETTQIALKLRIVTPLFIGGADPKDQPAEIRAASIKGLLRFWYRVIFPDTTKDEAVIFGGQEKGQGQSLFLLRVASQTINHGNKGDERWDRTKTAYLGYGVINRDKKIKKEITTRPYIKSDSHFDLIVLFKPLSEGTLDPAKYEEYKRRVRMAIWAWVMFGGLGSRARNGFGSLVVESATGMTGLPDLSMKNTQELRNGILEYIKKIPPTSTLAALPSYTHWSKDVRCLVTCQGKNGEDALENLAGKIHAYRSYKSLGRLGWVQIDHDLMDKFVQDVNQQPLKPPLRSAFGLPHNYFFSGSQKSGEVNFIDENGKKGRRGSPLFFSIYEFSKGGPACAVALFLPAKLIPANKTVRLSTGEENTNSYQSIDVALPDDFKALTDVLDELAKAANSGKTVYP